MTITGSELMAVGVPLVLGIVWLVRLEGRINVNDARHEDIVDRLERIERKLDLANGHSRD